MHLRQGTASRRASVWLGLGGVPGAVVGALAGLALSAVVLGVVFGTFTLAMAIREIIELLRRRHTEEHG